MASRGDRPAGSLSLGPVSLCPGRAGSTDRQLSLFDVVSSCTPSTARPLPSLCEDSSHALT